MEVFIDDAALFFLGRDEMYIPKVLGLMGGVMVFFFEEINECSPMPFIGLKG